MLMATEKKEKMHFWQARLKRYEVVQDLARAVNEIADNVHPTVFKHLLQDFRVAIGST